MPFSDLTHEERALFRKLNAPRKIQDFLDTLPMNYEFGGYTCYSPRKALRKQRIHCMEGAVLAAAILHFHGEPPLLMDLAAGHSDSDHAVALFKRNGRWGAISKTNHAVLRYRDPVYRDLRELAMSYFHEYYLDPNGEKTLRSYSDAVDLRAFEDDWVTSEQDIWAVYEHLFTVRHHRVLTRAQIASLRPADKMTIVAGRDREWGPKGTREA